MAGFICCGPTAQILACSSELRVQRAQQTHHRLVRQSVVLIERELRHQRGAALVGERSAEWVQRSNGRIVSIGITPATAAAEPNNS
jgi:hypothetical protein